MRRSRYLHQSVGATTESDVEGTMSPEGLSTTHEDETMVEALRILLAKEAIREVLQRYCRGVDRGDAELIKTVYHDDAIDEHGFFKGSGTEFADLIAAKKRAEAATSIHFLGNSLFDHVQGTRADVETYFISFNEYLDSDANHQLFAGRYLDTFEERDGEWRIVHRMVVHDWSTNIARRGQGGDLEAIAVGDFPQGDWSPEDPVYEMIRAIEK